MREDVKARKALPYEGKPTWHGLYLDGGIWRIVRNAAHLPIAYASESAAIADYCAASDEYLCEPCFEFAVEMVEERDDQA